MANEESFMLTSYNNPYNPFDDFEVWFKFDQLFGFDCCGMLDKEANLSDVASDEINSKEIVEAMKRIVEKFPMIYKMVSRKDFETNG